MFVITFLCCVMFAGLTEGSTTGSAKCDYGTYQHEGNTCCLCPKGNRVVSDCTITDDSKCERCGPDSYLDHPNNENQCKACQVCDHNANMEVKERCSLYSNTICKCQKNHYCEKGEQCRTCYPCDKCENKEVETECTETNNTVCRDAKNTRLHGVIAAAVLVPIIIISIISIVFYVWKRKKSRKHEKCPEMPEEVEPLKKDVDLNPYLPEIADHLSWKMMKRVARSSGMTNASIENHECNHPNDAKEQTNGLLQEWYQKQGLYEAYPALIRTLRAIKERTAADKIMEIVEGNHRLKARP